MHTRSHDTNIGHILAFVTCLGNTYVHMRMNISTSMCKHSVRTDTSPTMHAYMPMHMRMHMHMYMHMHMHISANISTCTACAQTHYTHMHTHTHVHMRKHNHTT